MAVGRDAALARVEQGGGDAGAAMAGRDKNLLDLVADHRHEPDNGAAVGGDHGVGDPVRSPRAERVYACEPPRVRPAHGPGDRSRQLSCQTSATAAASEARAGRSAMGMVANLRASAALFHSLTKCMFTFSF